MKTLLALALVFSFAGSAHAAKSCTDQPKDKWMSEADFKKKAEADGYKIKKFKTPGTCLGGVSLRKVPQKIYRLSLVTGKGEKVR